MSNFVRPHRRQPTRLPRPWDSPGKNTGLGCHFLLQCMKVKSESEVTQSCPTLHDPMDCSLPGSSVHGIFQARVLEWVAIRLFVANLGGIKVVHGFSNVLVVGAPNPWIAQGLTVHIIFALRHYCIFCLHFVGVLSFNHNVNSTKGQPCPSCLQFFTQLLKHCFTHSRYLISAC